MKCKQCQTKNAYKVLEEGRYFVHCVFCGYHDYLKTYNKKYANKTQLQKTNKHRGRG